jgi:putative ABC transport system ATP-binding protein
MALPELVELMMSILKLQKNQPELVRSIVDAHNIVKEYSIGNAFVPAVRGVSLRISPGEFVAVIGPSGSGKSTLMNLLGCLDMPSSGIYRFNGTDVSRLGHVALARLRNAEIGFVFQNFNLLPRLDAQENVELPLIYAGVRRKQRHERVSELLLLAGLDDRRHHRPSQLSGGQQQRVAIARALANSPTLILADEPTGALDSRSSAEIMKVLQTLNRQGITIVLITHEPYIAAYAQRIITLWDGRITDDVRQEAKVA